MPEAIQDALEFYYGLTEWTNNMSVQVRESDVIFFDRTNNVEIPISLKDAARIRDLLNVATARGYL